MADVDAIEISNAQHTAFRDMLKLRYCLDDFHLVSLTL
jgi:hypothetical protein